MKQTRFIVALFVVITNVSAQKGITFTVEELSKPEKVLNTVEGNAVFDRICKEYSTKSYRIATNSVAQSNLPDKLVNFGYHSFFKGLYSAYADHRPFVLSPDMIWLLISQGFAQHVEANAETLRPKLVNFDGKKTLVVRNDNLKLDSPSSEWEKIFPSFTKQMEQFTSPGLINLLTSNFSTTTPVERIASQITVMDALEPYFEYTVMRIVCGIPAITLKGTPQDWQAIYDRTKKLAAYDLAWWTDELEPILKLFIETSKGKPDVEFWKNMFKYRGEDGCLSTEIIDGWSIKFFPYNKQGKRNNLKELKGSGNLPEELSKVNLDYVEIGLNGDTISNIPLELWAGFVGLEQRESDYTLTPVIGWMVRKRDLLELTPRKSEPNMFGSTVNIPRTNASKNNVDSIDIVSLRNELLQHKSNQ